MSTEWRGMPVKVGKYSAYIVLCARKHLYDAQNFFAPRKYILVASTKLYECANIYLTAQKYLGLRKNYFAYPQKTLPIRRKLFTAAEKYVLR